MLLAALMIVTLLQVFQPKAAFADEGDPGTGTNTSNPPANPPSFIWMLSGTGSDAYHTKLHVITDTDGAPTNSVIHVYKQGSSAEIASFTSGTSHQFEVSKPATGYDHYYATVNGITSTPITVTSYYWQISLQVDNQSFATNEATPQLSVDLNHSLSGQNDYSAYFVDSTSKSVLQAVTSGTTATASINRFYTGEAHYYTVYIADRMVVTANTKVEDLTGIQADGGSVSVQRASWQLSLSLDKASYATDGIVPHYTLTANQSLASSYDSSGTYSIYLFDQTAGRVVDTFSSTVNGLNSDGTQTFTGSLPRFYQGNSHTYIAYVAATSGSVQNESDLSDTQASSQTAEVGLTPWNVNLSLDHFAFSTNDTTAEYTWQVNQPVSSSEDKSNTYAVYVFDETTGQKLSATHYLPELSSSDQRYQTDTLPIDRFYDGGAHTYKAYVALWDAALNSVSDLQDVKAESASVMLDRTPWEISLSADKTTFSTDEVHPGLTWQTNQSLASSRDTSNTYGVYVFDETADKLVDTWSGNSYQRPYTADEPRGKTGLSGVYFQTGGPHTYRAYVARLEASIGHESQLTDIQATSQSVTVGRLPWAAGLDSKETINPDGSKRVTLSGYTNQPINNMYTWNRSGYALYVVKVATGDIVARSTASPNTEVNWTIDESANESGLYQLYVAKYSTGYLGDFPTKLSDLRDIQAVSNISDPSQSISGPTYPGEAPSGSNPNEANCRPCWGDPIDTYSGSFFENKTDLAIQSVIPFEFTRSYSSAQATDNGSLGYGWTSNYDMALKRGLGVASATALKDASRVVVSGENGSLTPFSETSNGSYTAPYRVLASLTYDDTSSRFILTRNNGYRFYFSAATGQLLKIEDRNENALNFSYASGKLAHVASSDGKYADLDWASNRISSIEDNAGRTVSYSYDLVGNLSSASSLISTRSTEYGYNYAHQVTSVSEPAGNNDVNTTTNEYADDRVVQQTRPDGKVYQFEYALASGSSNQTVQVTDPSGAITFEEYNVGGQLVKEVKAYGTDDAATTRLQYGATGKVTQKIDPEGHVSNQTYDAAGNLIASVDPLNRTTAFTYNAFNQLLSTTDALGHVATNTYDAEGNLKSATDFEGNPTKYEINSNGTLHSVESPNAVAEDATHPKTVFAYDVNNFLTGQTDSLGNQTTYNVNELGENNVVTDAVGNTTSYAYDTLHRPISSTMPNGAVVSSSYDNSGRLQSSTDVLGRESDYTYDVLGNVDTIVNLTANSQIIYAYDEMNRVKKITSKNATGSVEYKALNYTYDLRGNLLTSTDANGNTTTNTYYLNDWLKTSTDPMGIIKTYSYDAVGNVTGVETASSDGSLSTTSSATYDALNRLTTSINSEGISVGYTYDKNGRVTKETRNDGSTVKNEYDADGNVTKVTNADATYRTYSYDAADNLVQEKDEAQQETGYTYTALNQVKKVAHPDASSEYYRYDSVGHVKQISYDNWQTVDSQWNYGANSQLTSDLKNGVETSYLYDANGNLTYRGPEVTGDPTQGSSYSDGITYAYDSQQRQQQVAYPNDSQLGMASNYFEYDPNGNVVSAGGGGQNVEPGSSIRVENQYNADNQLVESHYANGTVQTWTYDSLQRQTATQVSNASGQVLWSKDLALKSSGFIASKTVTDHNVNSGTSTSAASGYAYDDLGQLSSATPDSAPDNDGDGSPDSNPYTVNPRGQLTHNGTRSQHFNALSQITSAEDAAPWAQGLQDEFTYDVRGNLTNFDSSMQDWNDPSQRMPLASVQYSWTEDNLLASASTSYSNTAYNYDAAGLISSKSVSFSGQTTSPEQQKFTWDETQAVSTLLSDGTKTYFYAGSSTPFAQLSNTDGKLTYLYQDELGSVDFTADKNGYKKFSLTYGPYGNFEHIDGSFQDTPSFGFAGQYRDSDTGMYYMRARWYSSSTGSFISEDPLVNQTGLAYGYAAGNPLSYRDPLGLDALGDLSNFAAGFGDSATAITGIPQWLIDGGFSNPKPLEYYSATASFRQLIGVDYTVDYCSGAYAGGEVASAIVTLPFLVRDAVGFMTRLPEIVSGLRQGFSEVVNFIRRIDWGDETGSTTLFTGFASKRPGFADKDLLTIHFEDHGADFGASSRKQYEAMAQDFLEMRNLYDVKVDVDGNIRVYDEATNTLGSYRPNGTIRTFLKPSGGIKYWNNQPGERP